MTMGAAGQTILLGLLLVTSAIWLGGWFAVFMVARSTTATLPQPERVKFFRHFGRRYGIVATVALIVALITGAVLLFTQAWTAVSTALTIAAAVLLVTLCIGIVQARRMTRLRRARLAAPEDATLASRIGRGARTAIVLRAAIGVISVVMLMLAVVHGVCSP